MCWFVGVGWMADGLAAVHRTRSAMEGEGVPGSGGIDPADQSTLYGIVSLRQLMMMFAQWP